MTKIIYTAVIDSNNVVLAQHPSRPDAQVEKSLSHLFTPSFPKTAHRKTVKLSDRLNIHVERFVEMDGFSVVCVAQSEMLFCVCYDGFIQDVHSELMKLKGINAYAAKQILTLQTKMYNNPETCPHTMVKVQKKVRESKNQVLDCIDLALDREEKLNEIREKSGDLLEQSQTFKKDTRKMRVMTGCPILSLVYQALGM